MVRLVATVAWQWPGMHPAVVEFWPPDKAHASVSV
jgi:hypothetical protein